MRMWLWVNAFHINLGAFHNIPVYIDGSPTDRSDEIRKGISGSAHGNGCYLIVGYGVTAKINHIKEEKYVDRN